MRMLHLIIPSRIPMRRRLVNIIWNLTQWPQAVISDRALLAVAPTGYCRSCESEFYVMKFMSAKCAHLIYFSS
jgi:hypothetical protein